MRTAIYLILFFTISQALAAQQDILQKEIAKILKFESPVDFNIVPGILVGVIDGDNTYVCSYGDAMSKDSVYELGSVTKPIVAWLVEKALDSLGWSLPDPVCRFVPDSICVNEWKSLTINQLLEHRSGLMRIPAGIEAHDASATDPYAAYTTGQFAADIKGMVPEPGKYSYSNVGYALFSWLFDRVGGLDFFLRKRLNDPLVLKHTGFSFTDEVIASGHGLDGRKQPPWHTNAMATAIGLKSSLEDVLTLLRYISPQYAESAPTLTPAFKKELIALSKRDEYKVFDGWFLIQSGSSLVFYHTGRTGGHQVSVAFILGSMKGVVVFSNGAAGSNDLCLRVLDMINK